MYFTLCSACAQQCSVISLCLRHMSEVHMYIYQRKMRCLYQSFLMLNGRRMLMTNMTAQKLKRHQRISYVWLLDFFSSNFHSKWFIQQFYWRKPNTLLERILCNLFLNASRWLTLRMTNKKSLKRLLAFAIYAVILLLLFSKPRIVTMLQNLKWAVSIEYISIKVLVLLISTKS